MVGGVQPQSEDERARWSNFRRLEAGMPPREENIEDVRANKLADDPTEIDWSALIREFSV